MLVVAVGYNDLASMTKTSFEQVVGRARQLGYRQIVWWTLRAVDNGFAARNAVIRDQLATGNYPDVVIADWDGYTSNRPQWFVADGVHFRPIGAWAAADYLSRKMAFLEQRPCPAPTSPGAAPQVPCPDPDLTGPIADIAALYPIGVRVNGGRWAWAEIDLDAVDHNVRLIREVVTPAAVWAVVKADGYGHGAPAVAAQALRSGAAGLCVALAHEGIDLRREGIEAPILVLSEQPPEQVGEMLAAGLTPTVYSTAYVDALAAAVASGAAPAATCTSRSTRACNAWAPNRSPWRRCSPTFARSHRRCPRRRLHAPRLRRRSRIAGQRRAARLLHAGARRARCRGLRPASTHAANSAGALAHPASRYDMVRAGIAIYGISPGPGVDDLARDLRPVLSLRARVSLVKRAAAGDARVVRLAAPLRTRHHSCDRSDRIRRRGTAPARHPARPCRQRRADRRAPLPDRRAS